MGTKLKRRHEENVAFQAEKELRQWGRWHKRIVIGRVKCNLGELVDLGMHIPSGYAAESYYYPEILQTHRVWIFMPAVQMRAVYMHYVYDTPVRHKASLLRVSGNQFRRWVAEGFKFYCQYRDTNFNFLIDI